jgi:hypothetical protein
MLRFDISPRDFLFTFDCLSQRTSAGRAPRRGSVSACPRKLSKIFSLLDSSRSKDRTADVDGPSLIHALLPLGSTESFTFYRERP